MNDPCGQEPSPELIVGIGEFNRREFFECHETLEALWLAEPGPLREMYQGILQVGVGFYHLGRGNFRGAVRTARRGLDHLGTLPAHCRGIDVEKLVAETRVALQRMVDLGPNRTDDFDERLIPTIDLKRSN